MPLPALPHNPLKPLSAQSGARRIDHELMQSFTRQIARAGTMEIEADAGADQMKLLELLGEGSVSEEVERGDEVFGEGKGGEER
jgi:hypothetical protein